MNIKIQKSDLLKALTTAIKAVPSKSAIPITDFFLFRSSPADLLVTATDTNLTIVTRAVCEGEDGEVLVPARTILDIVRTLPNDIVTISTAGKTATIEWKNGKSAIPCEDSVQDYPNVGVCEGETFCKVKSAELMDALKHTAPCVADDQLRPVLCGVYFHNLGGSYNLVASDSHVMCYMPLSCEGDNTDSFVIPGNVASLLKDAMTDDDVVIRTQDNAIFFSLGDTTIQCRKVEGKFPNYASVFPKEAATAARCNVDILKSAIRRVSVCSNKSTNHIKFTFNAFGSTVEGQDLSFGTEARETIEGIEYDGADTMVIGFKADYIMKLLDAQNAGEVTLGLTDPKRAVIIEGDASRMLVMPVAIQ